MSRFGFSLTCALALLASPVAAQQGYQYTITATDDGTTVNSVMSFMGAYFKAEISVGDTEQGRVAFDGNTMIMSDGTQYFELTREMAEQLGNMMSGMGGMMENAMAQARANMSEEDLEELKKLGIPGLSGGADEAPRVSALVASSAKDSAPLGACTVHRYEFDDGTPDQELCVADKAVPGFEASKVAMQGFQDFFSSIRDAMASSGMTGMTDMMDNGFGRMDELDGAPLMGKQWAGGNLVSEWVMTDAREVSLSADDFGPPPGLPKADMGMPIGDQ
ncbi:MAG: hypothetical protein ACR2QM_03815 [Longimicrobiales bacterium]